MLHDAWLDVRSKLVELWFFDKDLVLVLAMLTVVAVFVYRWLSSRA